MTTLEHLKSPIKHCNDIDIKLLNCPNCYYSTYENGWYQCTTLKVYRQREYTFYKKKTIKIKIENNG